MERPREDPQIRLDRPRCPFCHGDVVRGEDVAVCRDCDAKHHADCWPAEGACATCGGGVALRAAGSGGRSTVAPVRPAPITKVDDEPARDRRPPDAALRRHLEIIGELRKAKAKSLFRNWWAFLLPHVYIPLFWPIFFIAYMSERSNVRSLVEEARSLERRYGLDVGDDEQEVLLDAAAWSGS